MQSGLRFIVGSRAKFTFVWPFISLLAGELIFIPSIF